MSSSVPNAETLQAHWVTSSYSGGGNDCVQVASLGDGPCAVRDSTYPSGPALLLGADAWAAFLAGVRGGGTRASRRLEP